MGDRVCASSDGVLRGKRGMNKFSKPPNSIRKPKAPCKDCANRVLGCHGTCERYAEYKTGIAEEKERVKAAYSGESLAENYTIKTILRIQRNK